MDYLVMGAVVFFALLAVAPKAVIGIGLMLAWAGGLLALLWSVAQGAIRLLG